jgi:hypothetical protein
MLIDQPPVPRFMCVPQFVRRRVVPLVPGARGQRRPRRVQRDADTPIPHGEDRLYAGHRAAGSAVK